MTFVRALFSLHLLALLFGLGGLLIALPHPELWAGSALAQQVFTFGISHGGALHILCGAATMLAFGAYAIGWRRTLVFFVVGTLVPLGAELTGTATGWPFGGYSYTEGLGVKVAGRVPYSVPLSWFYMGFAAFLLAAVIVQTQRGRRRAWLPIVLGAWLLMAWDLVLDPAMATPSMPVRFWAWHQSGAYFGMPPRNLVGWFGTGLAFMTLSRLLWRGMPDLARIPVWLPYGVYLANVVWAMALAISVGLWPAALAALVLGLAPATLVWSRERMAPADHARAGGDVAASRRATMSDRAMVDQ
jgi:putative membrane protein